MIGAVLAGGMGAAQADITVFGHIDTAIVSHDADNGFVDISKMPDEWFSNIVTTAFSSRDDINFQCTTCSIGFKGSEDLGNGLQAIFKLDFQFDTINRNKGGDPGSLTDRDQWIGLAGGFGKVRIGTISTGYKSHGAMIDPLYRTAAQGRSNGLQSFLHANAGEDGEGRATNTIRWDSADFNGFKLVAHYTLDSDEKDGSGGSDEDNDAYGIGAQYTNGGILVFADYLTNDGDDINNNQGDITAWKVGGKYTINNFSVMGQYEDIEDKATFSGEPGRQAGTWWHLAGTYTMGNNMIYLGYGVAEGEDLVNGLFSAGNEDSEQTAITIAGTHSLSKRTTIYAAYTMQEQDNDAAINAFLASPPFTTVPGFPTTGSPVNDPEKDVFAIGIKHKF